MEWMKLIGDAIQYIEDHITEDLSPAAVARQIHISPFYFQKGFAMLCGFTLGEYVRNRRLALAGNDLATGDARVIDIALKYGYDSPESFAKAFSRFHGITPMQARKSRATLKSFAPLKIHFTLEGGYLMDYRIEKKEAFTVLGHAQTFPYEGAKNAIPQFWRDHHASDLGRKVMGAFGVNIDLEMSMNQFEYLIADPCAADAPVPEGLTRRTIPAFTWAVFPVRGAMPQALQDLNTKIYTELLPALKDYEFAAGYCMEYYDNPANYPEGTLDAQYYCEIWIPIRKK